jgi:hypothetical protein
MTIARKTTDRTREFELLKVTDHAEWVLRDADGDVFVFEEWSPLERVEVRCDLCGKWGTDVAPAPGFDDSRNAITGRMSWRSTALLIARNTMRR